MSCSKCRRRRGGHRDDDARRAFAEQHAAAAATPGPARSSAPTGRGPLTHASASVTASPPSAQIVGRAYEPGGDGRATGLLHRALQRRDRAAPADRPPADGSPRGTPSHRGSPSSGPSSAIRSPLGLEPLGARGRRRRRGAPPCRSPASAGSPAPGSHCRRRRCRRPPGFRARGRPRAIPCHRLLELPEDLRSLGRAEVQAVGQAERPGAGDGQVARRLGHRHGGPDTRIEIDETRVAVRS